MIIDIHTHLLGPNMSASRYWDSWVRLFSTASNKPSEVVRKLLPEFWDETGDRLVADMDTANISQSWVSVLDMGLCPRVGEPNYSIEEQNRRCAEIASNHKDRIIPMVSVDPRREGADRLVERAVKEWGMKGLKLLPAAGFYPNDSNCYKLYRKVSEFGLPIIVHTGPETIPLYSKYCYPIFLDEVATDFPEMPVIMAHAGFCWWPEALKVAETKPNVFLDLAGWQAQAVKHPMSQFYQPLRLMIDNIGAARILFGSDWPAFRLFCGGQANWVHAFTSPPPEVEAAGITFTPDEINSILGENAARLIKGK